MNPIPNLRPITKRYLTPVLLTVWLASAMASAAPIAIATSPLATSTASPIKPNLLFVLDNSGSMQWDHMPDDASDGGSAVSFIFGFYGLRSSQCNQVYYNPALTYLPPVTSAGVSYPNASFTAAWTNGFNTGAGTVNLNTSYIASQSLNADATGGTAYYYAYSGSQNTLIQKNYQSTTNTFYNECHSAENTAPGNAVFSKRKLSTSETTTLTVTGSSATTVSSITVNGVQLMSATSASGGTSPTTTASNIAARITLNGFSATASNGVITITGPTSAANFTPVITKSGSMVLTADIFPDTAAANLTNFANWYSYYRTRLLMMKTASGRAFSSLTANYRVGLMQISSSTPIVAMNTFEGIQRDTWYSSLYNITTSGSTPLRRALSDAGRYYAGKLGGVDPVQYSCQQNFTILSTDGYWNTGAGYQVDGSTPVGNQDNTASRPMFDGAQAVSTTVTIYTRNTYSKVTDTCSGNNKKVKTQPEIQTCTSVGGAAATCSAWSNNGTATLGTTCNTSNPPACGAAVSCSSTPVQQSSVTTPGSIGGSSDSLADVAMYYYQTDLRTPALGNCVGVLGASENVCTNNVFIGSSDNNLQQHMTTFTLGLGASGWMNYSSSYLSDISGDYVSVKLGSPASASLCTWQAAGTTCNWPLPGISGSDGFIANIDDLWHAAVDGRGAYFSATDPATLSIGLANALTGINARQGSAAAAATSTLNPVAGNNFAYVASYTTVKWQGNLEARGINVDTGVVSQNATWCVEDVVASACASPSSIVADNSGGTTAYYCSTPNSVTCTGGVLNGSNCLIPATTSCLGTMNGLVSSVSDTRSIWTANNAGTGLVAFDSAYATANPGNFSAAHISGLTQWPLLTAAQQTVATGANLINYLRGQNGYEDRTGNLAVNRLYRYREAVLGDALESQPAYIGSPVFSYPYAGYSAYVTAQAARAGTVYMGANDGMMHAFAADTGIERWAYIPSMVIPNLWHLADSNYANLHTNFANGSATTSDVCTANCANPATASWRTILVAGLNGGGRGYYALDITVPTNPILLWEFTPTTGNGIVKDDDVGYAFGQPVIARKADGTWVVLVTSGYNNINPGSGIGYLYVLNAATGAIISKISTATGSITTPSGLSKISVWNDEPGGNLAGYVYGGDLLGNVWRFDINVASVATIGNGSAFKFASLFSDNAGTLPQAITTVPVLGVIAGKRVIFVSTGKYLEISDLSTTQIQTQYAIKDDDTVTTLINPRTTLIQQTLSNNPDGTATRISSNNNVNFYTGRGWYVDFPDTAERANLDSKLIAGTLLTPTIVPSNTVCSPGGYGWLNYLNYATGGAVNPSQANTSSVKLEAPIVGMNVLYIQGAPQIRLVTSNNPTPAAVSGTNVLFSTTASGFTGKRVMWRELIP